jgi:hypothetical protein
MNVKISQEQMDRIILKYITTSVGKLTTDNDYYDYDKYNDKITKNLKNNYSYRYWVNGKGTRVIKEMYQSDPIKTNHQTPFYINGEIYYGLLDDINRIFNLDKYETYRYIIKWVDQQIGNKGIKLGVFSDK